MNFRDPRAQLGVRTSPRRERALEPPIITAGGDALHAALVRIRCMAWFGPYESDADGRASRANQAVAIASCAGFAKPGQVHFPHPSENGTLTLRVACEAMSAARLELGAAT